MKPSSSILNTRLWQLLTVISELLELSLCWSLCSLPVITMGAASAAMLDVLTQLRAGGDGHVVKQFFRAMKRCWRRATICWLGALVLGGLLMVDLTICFQNFSGSFGWAVLTGLLVGASLLLFAALVYLLLAARGDEPVRRLAGISALLAVRHLPLTLVILLSGILGIWGMGRLWWIAFLFPAFFALPMAKAADRALERYPCAAKTGAGGEQP